MTASLRPGQSAGAASLLEAATTLRERRRQRHPAVVVVDELSAILRIDSERVDPDQVIAEMGMDSLTSVELRAALEARLDMEIPLSTLSSGGTLRAMSGSIARLSAAPAPADEVVSRILQFEAPDNEPLLEAVH